MRNLRLAPKNLPLFGMLLYLVMGVCWVSAGDALLAHWVTDPRYVVRIQTWKGWAYVLLTSALAGWLLQRVRRAEEERTSVGEELQQISRYVPAGIARAAMDGRFLWANSRLCETLGAPLAHIQALNFREVLVVADRDWATRQLELLLDGEIDHYVSERHCVRLDDGRTVPVLVTVTLVQATAENPAHLVCVVQDFGELSAAREALQRSETRQRLAATVVDNTLEGVIVTDAQSRILSVNAAFTRLLGYTEDEMLGQTPRAFHSGRHDAAFYAAMWQQLTTTGYWQGEIWNRRKNGDVFPEHMSLSAVRDQSGVITHYVCMFVDITEEKQQRERLEFLARNDALTGLYNRTWFAHIVEQVVQEAGASQECLAVLLLNLDRFKDVNDSYGHAIGDEVLKHIAGKVRAALRPGDLLGRMAGDELAVLVRNVRHAEGAAAVARDLIAVVGTPWRSPDGLEVVVGVSVGISMYPAHTTGARTTGAHALLQSAHAAVYGAKALGRGAWCFFDETMTHAARERLELEARLRKAFADGHLHMYYQPQVDIATGRITGAEALMRWIDPVEGMISPARFIPVAETSGVIGPLGEWAVRSVCRQGQAWRAAGLPDLTLAVNISPRQFHLTDLAGSASTALAEAGFPAHLLEMEITESALAERADEARAVLVRLRLLGVRIAVDDFGTGYSSLAQLKRFPIDVLKIDQGFIRDIPRSADDMGISAAIIAMGQSLGMQVLAEGVETAEQLAFLRERGCNSYQGYLCSRPLAAEAFAQLLRSQAACVSGSAAVAVH